MKRGDYISWDEYFMGIAMLAARRSKDPNTQVGACIVSQDNIIISTGYNGMPKGCSDDTFPWDRTGEETKYPYVVHAELNAILNANGRDLRGSKLYVALFPCNECAKAIIQSGLGLTKDRTLAEAERDGMEFAQLAGVHSLEEMRNLTVEQVFAAAGPLIGRGFATDSMTFAPNIDGYLLEQGFDEALEQGNVHDIPYMAGSTKQDIRVDHFQQLMCLHFYILKN